MLARCDLLVHGVGLDVLVEVAHHALAELEPLGALRR